MDFDALYAKYAAVVSTRLAYVNGMRQVSVDDFKLSIENIYDELMDDGISSYDEIAELEEDGILAIGLSHAEIDYLAGHFKIGS